MLYGLGYKEAAEASYRNALTLRPDYAEAHYNRGIVLRDLRRPREAEAAYRQALHGLHLYTSEVRLTHNFWGVLISLIVSGFPFAFLLTLSYVTGIDPTLASAAATLGAGPWQQFRQIYLQLLMPGLTIAACL